MSDSTILNMTHVASPAGGHALYLQTAAGAGNEGYSLVDEVLALARMFPKPIVGRYYPMHPVFRATNGPALLGNARMYLVPFVLVNDISIDRIYVKTWGGGTAATGAIAIYDSQKLTSGYWPTGNVIAHGVSTFAPNSGFTSYEKALSEGTVTLKAGHVYFAALQCNEAISMYTNDLQLSIGLMGNSATEFDTSEAAYVSGNGVITVGTWPDLTTSQSSGNYSVYAPPFQMGFRIA
jgi:hypothetical protein